MLPNATSDMGLLEAVVVAEAIGRPSTPVRGVKPQT